MDLERIIIIPKITQIIIEILMTEIIILKIITIIDKVALTEIIKMEIDHKEIITLEIIDKIQIILHIKLINSLNKLKEM